jgi:hypothetical protein
MPVPMFPRSTATHDGALCHQRPRHGKPRALILAAQMLLMWGHGFSANLFASDPSSGNGAVSLPVRVSARSNPKEAPRHQCPCGIDCGGSCCCNRESTSPVSPLAASRTIAARSGLVDRDRQDGSGPRVEHSRLTTPLAATTTVDPPGGPCLNRFPCGGGTIPPSSLPVLRVVDSAVFSGRGFAAPDPAGTRFVLAFPISSAQSAPDPLDKPPRRFARS